MSGIRAIRADARDFEALARSVLERGDVLRFTAHGDSMRPFIRDGDVLLVRAAETRAIRRGDVLLHRTASGAVVAHRLASSPRRDVWVTAADQAIAHVDRIQPGDVIGRVVRRERDGRAARLDGPVAALLGLCWFHARPVRRLWRRLKALGTSARNRPGPRRPATA